MFFCMYCGVDRHGMSEWIDTGDFTNSEDGWELWFCCDICKGTTYQLESKSGGHSAKSNY